MAPKEVAPQLGLDSYSCPHCGALAHQFWFHVYPDVFERNHQPFVASPEMVEDFAKAKRTDTQEQRKVDALHDRFQKNEVTYEVRAYSSQSSWRMMNMFLSRCHACDAFSVWIKDRLAWPAHSLKIDPHPDIPANVKDDFIEAAAIVDASPRGSAALSRLIIQKLMVDLGESGKDINADIASLVKKGLESEIQQALDVVRVVGNNAVHPGKIDLTDDVGTALALLQLINLVIERRIATQKRIAEMFGNLPPGALKQITDRDSKNPGGA
ncbi:hypothetical protein ACVJGC_005473 [Bradyrhizobium diazoefficiens]